MLRSLLRAAQEVDNFFTRLVYQVFPKRYRRSGRCRRTGVCCRNIGIAAPLWIFNSRPARRLVTWWYQYVNEFFLKGIYPEEQVFIFGCPYLKENQCSRYRRRPPICRNYPSGGFFLKPATFKTCGFQFKVRT